MRSRRVLARSLAILPAILIASSMMAPDASATQLLAEPYTLEVLVEGAPVARYAARGTTYIEALEGREYSLRLRNNTSERVAIALSVDGLNSIDAKTTSARDASKWILDPYQSITLEGWQTSSSTARRFFFTRESDSYGAWLGRTRNLGVISAAIFRERRPRPDPISLHRDVPGAPSSPGEGARAESAPGRKSGAAAGAGASDELAATGIGRQVDHDVVRVRFEAEATPAAVITLRYEYRDALVRLGVLPQPCGGCDDPLARRERARGFEDLDFAPDPYHRPRR